MKELLLSILAASMWVGSAAATAQESSDQAAPQASAETAAPLVRIVLLGTGNPNAVPETMGPATAIVIGEQAYLVDAGTGIVRRAAEAYRDKGIEALRPARLNRVFLTHLHSDHTIGLPDLMLTSWTLGRTDALAVFGPPGTRAMMDHLSQAYAEDVRIRIGGLEPANTTGYRTEVTEIGDGFVYEDDSVMIEAFRVCHGSIRDAFGFKFHPKGRNADGTPGRVVFVSGDTTFCPALVRAAHGADVLVQEVYSELGLSRRESEAWKRYHRAFHTAASDVARLANTVKPKLVILTHEISWAGVPTEHILEEVTAHTDIKVVFGRDLDVY